MTLIYLASAWIAGIYAASLFNLPLGLLLTAIFLSLLVAVVLRHRRPWLLGLLCLALFLGGMLRYQSSLPTMTERTVHFYNERGEVEVKGRVAEDPRQREKSTLIRLSDLAILQGGAERKVSGDLLLRVPRLSHYSYGDLLLLKGKLETPPRLDNFDYKGYLAQQGIYSIMSFPRVKVVGKEEATRPGDWVYLLRRRLAGALQRALPEPQSALAQGLLLGLRSDIPSDLQQAFNRTGTTHILAISGLNISIVAGIALSFGVWLFGRQRSFYFFFALGVLWLYTLLAGMQPPVLRAALMGSLFLWGDYLGRQRSAATALLFAAALMIALSPRVLWDVSFQLSFMAMAGLVFLAPPLEEWGNRWIESRKFPGEGLAKALLYSVAVTIGAIIATFPLIAYTFGLFSLVGLPATLLALPALPAIIVTTALTGLLGLFVPPLALAAGWVSWLFLTYLIKVVELFGSLPFTALEVSYKSGGLVAGYYLALGAILGLSSARHRNWLLARASALGDRLRENRLPRLPRKAVALSLCIVAALVWTAALASPGTNLEVSFLDAGQGDAIFIRTPSGQNILVDGGASAQAISLQLGRRLPFWDRELDLIVATQPHADHLTGLVEVLRRYKVKQVLEPGVDYDSPIYREWRELLKSQRIPTVKAQAGQIFQIDGGEIQLEVLNPPVARLQGTASDIDNNGVVLRLSRGEISFLLTADVFAEAEQELLLTGAKVKSTILKVAHHGSRTSTSPAFLGAVSPQVAVISSGKDDPFDHPHSEVWDRLKERLGEERIYLTEKRGTVQFTTDGKRLWVRTER